jgi:Uma2 family endonuclease
MFLINPEKKTYSVRKYSIAEFLKTDLESGFLYELINGTIVRKTSPTPFHQRILNRLNMLINSFVLTNQLGEVFFAPVDVCLGENSLVNPDLLYVSISKQEIITKDGIMGSPDLVIEVLSPSTMKYDRGEKKELYERHQIPIFFYQLGFSRPC